MRLAGRALAGEGAESVSTPAVPTVSVTEDSSSRAVGGAAGRALMGAEDGCEVGMLLAAGRASADVTMAGRCPREEGGLCAVGGAMEGSVWAVPGESS